VLAKTASQRKTITYGRLMKKFGLTRGHGTKGIVRIIGEVDEFENRRGAPGFGAIIVRKDTGYPGGGYFCYGGLPPGLRRPQGQSANPKLSGAEKEYIASEQKAIWNYYRNRRPMD
jgi:hypothetical protein